MSKRRSVDDWRYAIFRSTQLGDRTKVLLLYLSDHMQPNRKVSIPRAQIARDLGRSERRVTERIAEAHDKGWLDTITRGQKGITAVYEGTFPDPPVRGRASVPQNNPTNPFSGTPTSPLKDAETRPLNKPIQAFSGTDGGPTNNEANPFLDPDHRDELRNEERACLQCGSPDCFHFACVDVAIATTDDQWRTA